MKQKLFIFLGLILLIAVLVGLNAASYTQKEKAPDSEIAPSRSTYNSGVTGTQAWYSLLSETGRKVVRWQEPPSALATVKDQPQVFVVIGSVRREFADGEIEQLLKWVAAGGRLVIIDREPPKGLITTTANWEISFDNPPQFELLSADPSDQEQMTHDTAAIKPGQPSVITQGVNAIQPSRFASAIRFDRFAEGGQGNGSALAPPPRSKSTPYDDDDAGEPPPPPRSITTAAKPIDTTAVPSPSQIAPVVHFASADKNILVEVPFGEGKIIYLSDPYTVSNAGISLLDNAQLAINLVAAKSGVVAFDEYHQGYGGNNNAFLKFFEGTPVVAMFFQALILVGLVFYSQSRRFARPVPEPEPDRLSKLEYVSAMAELQQRSRAYDLAIENIYTDFRRRAARLLGADNFLTKYEELARMIAERTGLDARSVADTLFKCEDIIRGEPTNKREVVELIAALRALEQKLGLTRAAKQKAGR
jgi:hypothetical protein